MTEPTHLHDYRGLLDVPADQLRQLTREEAETMLRCLSAGDDHTPAPGDEESMGFGYAVLKKRLEACGVPTTFTLRLLVTLLCRSPGQLVLWAYTLAMLHEERAHDAVLAEVTGLPAPDADAPVTIKDWAEAFPTGIPTDDAMSKAWDAQKRKGPRPAGATDNWLDTAMQWPALRRRAAKATP